MEEELILGLSPGDETTRTYANLQARLRAVQRQTGVGRIYLFGLEGQSLVDSEAGVPVGWRYGQLALFQTELRDVSEGRATSSVLFTGADGQLYKSGFAPLYSNGRVIAIVAVEGSAQTLRAIRALERQFVTWGLIGLLASALLGIAFSRRITQPLTQLANAAKAIGRGRYEEPIPSTGRDEVAFLGQTLEEMRRAIVARDTRQKAMLAGIAHEIRNPLGGIELFAGLLHSALGDGEAKALAGQAHAGKILKEVHRLKRIVSDFLEYARPAQPKREKCSLGEIVAEVQSLLGEELRGVRVHSEVPASLQAHVDPGHLRQVLLNLFRNSAQAMKALSGPREIRVVAHLNASRVVMRIEDTGPGIPAEYREHLFEPFFTTREQGTGLGLAIAKSRIEENGGAIRLVTAENSGAAFEIELPAA